MNFISIQNSAMIAIEGAQQAQVRTGYEYIIGQRTNDMFCASATEDGKVQSVDEHGIIVEYVSGQAKGITLGRIYGRAEGSVYPHDITTTLKAGQKFKKGQILAYNTKFFEPDWLDPSQVVLKTTTNARVALYESAQTHEDSCSVAKSLSSSTRAETTKVKSFTVNFAQNVREVVKVGQKVSPKDVLMVIEDEITSGGGSFDEASLAVLKKLANQAPRAGYLGVVDRIEVFYHGDKSDMSPTLKTLADASDRFLKAQCTSSGKPVITGYVTDDYRVEGVPLAPERAEIKIYITVKTISGVGDKIVFAGQAKSVIGEVMHYDMTTESGLKIDAVFGLAGIYRRMINNPLIIGTTSSLLEVIAKKALQAYGQ